MAYADAVLNRLLPTFDDLGTEAEEVSRREYERLGEMPAFDEEPIDVVEASERAFEAGLTYYESMSGVAQAMANLAAAGLYHLFEQQVMVFHRRQVLSKAEENDLKYIRWSEFEKRIQNAGADLKQLQTWSQVDELRLVANTVKHGEGASAARLRQLRPELFVHPGLRDDPTWEGEPVGSAEMPMGGEDIYVTRDDLERYRDALVSFWREFGDAIIEADAHR
jgi:hypothetical protein